MFFCLCFLRNLWCMMQVSFREELSHPYNCLDLRIVLRPAIAETWSEEPVWWAKWPNGICNLQKENGKIVPSWRIAPKRLILYVVFCIKKGKPLVCYSPVLYLVISCKSWEITSFLLLSWCVIFSHIRRRWYLGWSSSSLPRSILAPAACYINI